MEMAVAGLQEYDVSLYSFTWYSKKTHTGSIKHHLPTKMFTDLQGGPLLVINGLITLI